MQASVGARRLPGEAEGEYEYVEFWPAGAHACGEFGCVACGYALVSFGVLSRCPVCAEGLWEQDVWSPFTRMAGARNLDAGDGRCSLDRVIPRVASAGFSRRSSPN